MSDTKGNFKLFVHTYLLVWLNVEHLDIFLGGALIGVYVPCLTYM